MILSEINRQPVQKFATKSVLYFRTAYLVKCQEQAEYEIEMNRRF